LEIENTNGGFSLSKTHALVRLLTTTRILQKFIKRQFMRAMQNLALAENLAAKFREAGMTERSRH
jgi:hypothetical protein